MFFRSRQEPVHLNDKDFSAAAGFSVKTFDLADFPHYDELRRNLILKSDKLQQRADAIYVALEEAGLTGPEKPFGRKDAEAVAVSAFAIVRSKSESVSLSNIQNIPYFRHFNLIQRDGFEKAHQPDSNIWCTRNDSAARDVFPGVLNEDVPVLEDPDTGNKVFRRYAAFILTDHRVSARQHWAKSAKIAEELLVHVPNDEAYILADDEHEKRHLKQLFFKSSSAAPEFYAEVDADMASNAELRRKNVGQKTIKAGQHYRYMDLLLNDGKEYWFAPTLGALEKRQEPKDFYTTVESVSEIRMRIAMRHRGEDDRQVSSATMQNAVAARYNHPGAQKVPQKILNIVTEITKSYDALANSLIGQNPAPLYTTLRLLVDSGALTDSFTRELGGKILEGACHFNPDLIHQDREASRRRMDAAFPPQRLQT